MSKKTETKIGCILTAGLFVLIAVLSSRYYSPINDQQSEGGGISWVDAVEKCKTRYRTISDSWKVKVPNCRKRTEDDQYYYFFWTKPVAIFIEQANGQKSVNEGQCQVEKETGEIVYMTLDRSVVVNKIENK